MYTRLVTRHACFNVNGTESSSLLLVHTADRVLRLYDPVTLALRQRFQDHVERVQWHRPVFCGTGAFVAVGMLRRRLG